MYIISNTTDCVGTVDSGINMNKKCAFIGIDIDISTSSDVGDLKAMLQGIIFKITNSESYTSGLENQSICTNLSNPPSTSQLSRSSFQFGSSFEFDSTCIMAVLPTLVNDYMLSSLGCNGGSGCNFSNIESSAEVDILQTCEKEGISCGIVFYTIELSYPNIQTADHMSDLIKQGFIDFTKSQAFASAISSVGDAVNCQASDNS